MGSVAGALIRTAPCPVMVVPKERPESMRFSSIVVAVDLSPVSSAVLERALVIAQKSGATLHVVSMLGGGLLKPSAEELQAQAQAREAALQTMVQKLPEHRCPVQVHAVTQLPASEAILETAQLLNADLIAVGTSGRNAWHRMIVGSTATGVLEGAQVPVLVVPNDVSG